MGGLQPPLEDGRWWQRGISAAWDCLTGILYSTHCSADLMTVLVEQEVKQTNESPEAACVCFRPKGKADRRKTALEMGESSEDEPTGGKLSMLHAADANVGTDFSTSPSLYGVETQEGKSFARGLGWMDKRKSRNDG